MSNKRAVKEIRKIRKEVLITREKRLIEKVVSMVIKEYGETLRLLGNS